MGGRHCYRPGPVALAHAYNVQSACWRQSLSYCSGDENSVNPYYLAYIECIKVLFIIVNYVNINVNH